MRFVGFLATLAAVALALLGSNVDAFVKPLGSRVISNRQQCFASRGNVRMAIQVNSKTRSTSLPFQPLTILRTQRLKLQKSMQASVKYLLECWKKGKLYMATALLFLSFTIGRAAKAGAISVPSASQQLEQCVSTSRQKHQSKKPTSTNRLGLKNIVAAESISKQQQQQTRLGKSIRRIEIPSEFIKHEKEELMRWGRFAEKEVEGVFHDTEIEVEKTFKDLFTSLQGAKLDTLILLIVTSAVIPIFKFYNVSSILGFLLFGTVLGPNGLNWLKDVHMIDMLGELGIVFFLFEIGLELSLERLMAMKRDVFGLGTSQFLVTSAFFAGASRLAGLPTAAAVTIGGSLALSSSAFVLQLLKDKNAMGSRVGRASFGILLLQDLAVVPLLVIVELLAKGGSGLGKALGIAGVKTVVAVTAMSIAGRKFLDPIFYFVAKSSSQEAFLSIILSTVLLMSFVTQGIGLSNTLGAFLAGLLLAETKYRYQVESDIAPFRGLLLGFFFITVGFSIDPRLLLTSLPQVLLLLAFLLASKAGIITSLSLANGMSFSDAQQTGILNAQVGEFAFVAFAIAERSSLISPALNKMLLTTVALSMALTPFLDKMGSNFASSLDARKASSSSALTAGAAVEDHPSDLDGSDFVLVCGYGRVGKMVCDMLDKKLVPYIALDNSPQRAKDARKAGLPVFFGDVNRPEVLKSFHAESAKACVITIDDMTAINKAVASVRNLFPSLPIVARAVNTQHQKRLQAAYENVYSMCPMLPEDSVLLTLPFGGAVLQQIGVSKPEIVSFCLEFFV